MDPNQLTPGIPSNPKSLKEKLADSTNELVKNNYESFLRKVINVIYALLKFIKNGLISMIKMAFGKE